MKTGTIFKKIVNLVTLSSFLVWNLAVAAPESGTVVGGSATISQSGTTTTINQTSQNAVINWQGFDTAANEAVRFNQPNSSAIALNRITSGSPTNFAGSLSANGHVWILNPAGVIFHSGSTVDVAGLLATTHDITNANFMSGNYVFSSVSGFENSKVINNGTITAADYGIVALVAPGVENNGVITAKMGKVHLASGTAFVLDLYGDQLINFGNSAPAHSGYVKNAGKIVAEGGKVYLTANSAAHAVDNVINMSGVIEARSVSSSHGTIVLNGGHHGKVKVSGKLNTSNVDPNGVGGFIETSGETLDVALGVVNPGKGGTWSIDPTLIIVNTNPVDGDWVHQIQDAINNSFDISLFADTILVTESITATGYCGSSCYPTLTMTANTLLDVLASITLVNANLTLNSYGILQTSSNATIDVTNGAIYLQALPGASLAEIDGSLNITNGSVYIYSDPDVVINGLVTAQDSYVGAEAGYWGAPGHLTVGSNGISATNSDVYLYARNSMEINAPITVTGTSGGVELNTSNYSIHINSEINVTGDHNAYFEAYAGGSVHIDAPITVINSDGYFCGEYAVYIEGGNDNWWGKVYINYPMMLDGGDAYIYTTNNIYVNDAVTVTNGGLEISTGFGGGNIYINAPVVVDNYLDIYPDYDVYVNAGLTVNDGELDIDASHKIYINTSDPLMADGNIYFESRVLLGANVTITSNNGNIYFDRAVDTSWCADPADLTLNVMNGFVKFRDNVGDNNPLNNLIVNGMTKFWNWCDSLDVITWLSQIYNGQVTANTDMFLLTIENGSIFLNQGYSAPDNYLALVTGAYFGGTGIFGNNINVYGLDLGGSGSADLLNTTINGIGGADAFAQAFIEGSGSHYCINNVGIGGCSVVPVVNLNELTTAESFVVTENPTQTNLWNAVVTDASGNVIEVCTEQGCVMTLGKTRS